MFVENRLNKFAQEFKDGKREGSIVSKKTVESISADEKIIWRTIRKELEDIGITVSAFKANKSLIFTWFQDAMSKGLFDEEVFDETLDATTMPISTDWQVSASIEDFERQVDDDNTSLSTSDGSDHRTLVSKISPSTNSALIHNDWQDTASTNDIEGQVGDDNTSFNLIESSPIQAIGPERKTLVSEVSPGLKPIVEHESSKGNGQKEEHGQSAQRKTLTTSLRVAEDSASNPNLSAAVNANNLTKVCKMLNGTKDLFLLRQQSRNSALYAASQMRGAEFTVQYLIAQEADVNAVHGLKRHTAIHIASRCGHAEIVQLLLDNGADVNASDADRSTPLICASSSGNGKVVELLLKNGAYVDSPAKYWTTALIMASSKGHANIVELLLKNGANVNASDRHENTALILASFKGYENTVELLLKKGADVHHKDLLERTALSYAAYKDNKSMVKLLLNHRAQIRMKEINKVTSMFTPEEWRLIMQGR